MKNCPICNDTMHELILIEEDKTFYSCAKTDHSVYFHKGAIKFRFKEDKYKTFIMIDTINNESSIWTSLNNKKIILNTVFDYSNIPKFKQKIKTVLTYS